MSSQQSDHGSPALPPKSFVDNLAQLDGRHSDFTIMCGDEQLPTHKIILECHSTYFTNLFKDNPEKDSIDLSNLPFHPLKNMHKVFYESTYDSSTDIEAILLLHLAMHELADRFGCQSLKLNAFQNLERVLKRPSIHVNMKDLTAMIRKIENLYSNNEQRYEELRTLFKCAAKRHLTKLINDEDKQFTNLLADYPNWTLSFFKLLDDEMRTSDKERFELR